jgi:hypothetical protein
MILQLATQWRDEAGRMRRRGVTVPADVLESCALELETRHREWELEELTLAEAELESQYSYSALQKMLASGELPNAGKKGSPRILRRDLPRKPRGQIESSTDLADSITRPVASRQVCH